MPGHAGAACHQQGCHQGPHFLCAQPNWLSAAVAFLDWACAAGVPPAAQQFQTSSRLGKPGACSAIPWAATTPSSRSVDPALGRRCSSSSSSPGCSPSAPGTSFSTVALYQSLITLYNKVSLFNPTWFPPPNKPRLIQVERRT